MELKTGEREGETLLVFAKVTLHEHSSLCIARTHGLFTVTVILELGIFTGRKTFAQGSAPAKPSPRDARLRSAPYLWLCPV